jgi:HSP20 family protein
MNEKSTAVQTSPEPTALRLVEPTKLMDRINRIHEDIARRAFEFFEQDGGSFGRELDHWFKAESELLHPCHMSITESEDSLTVQAEVPGFSANELEVSLEPRRLTISGKRNTSSSSDKSKGTTIYNEQCSSELLRVIELPADVDATKATAILKNGVLELKLPKAAAAKSTRIGVRAA